MEFQRIYKVLYKESSGFPFQVVRRSYQMEGSFARIKRAKEKRDKPLKGGENP